MCETEIVSCHVLNISPTITALLRKVRCKVIFGAPEEIRQAAGHGLFESALLLIHKIHAKQKEREDSNLWPSGSENYDRAV